MNVPDSENLEMKRKSTWIALVIAILLLAADAALACPTCKEDLAADPAAANLVRGYFWSILFMLSMPPLIFGGVSAYFYYEVRRARALKSLPATEEPAGDGQNLAHA